MDESPAVLDSSRRFEGRVFNVRIDTLRYEDGARARVDVVEHGDSIAIIATATGNDLVLVRQYRHPARAALWEIPAGSAQPDEDLIAGAVRELREETGYRAGRMRRVGSVWTTPGFCDEVMHFFYAEELVAGEPAPDEDERIEVGTFSQEAAWRLVANGSADAKTVLALCWMAGARGEIRGEFGR
jgi:ADP-ribose pyrophosphatase